MDIRDEIQDGDIVLFRGKSLISRIIRWVTRSDYTHAGILAWWNGRLMLIEAVANGIVASRMSIVVYKYSGHVELWTTKNKLVRSEVLRAAQLLLGKRYSTIKLFRNLKRMILGCGRREAPDPEEPPEGFVCSEFVSRVWRAGGIDLSHDSPDMFTKPSDIARSPRVHKVGDLFRARPGTFQKDTLRPPRALELEAGRE